MAKSCKQWFSQFFTSTQLIWNIKNNPCFLPSHWNFVPYKYHFKKDHIWVKCKHYNALLVLQFVIATFVPLKITDYSELVIESKISVWLLGFDYHHHHATYKDWLLSILLKALVGTELIRDFISILSFFDEIVQRNTER